MLEKIFKLKEKGTTVKTEVLAGVTTFLAMAYILAVNPQMLGETGMSIPVSYTHLQDQGHRFHRDQDQGHHSHRDQGQDRQDQCLEMMKTQLFKLCLFLLLSSVFFQFFYIQLLQLQLHHPNLALNLSLCQQEPHAQREEHHLYHKVLIV